ncbi:MAG: VCBS repeat-containing protein [Verrucomicrobiales bacterium]|nr:VCBS repeat-containing protein [Verrucomicrobiales bacterium]
MSKRSKILIAAGAPLLLVIALAILWVVLGRFGALDPVFTDERPTNRPIRLDHRLLERFSAQPVGEILETLQREASLMPPPAPATPAIVPFPPLLAMLPDAPLPYPESAAPRDAEGIKKFVTEMQQDTSEDPTDEERRQFNLALAALHVNPEKVPEAIRVDVRPTPESSVFPIRLSPREFQISGPFATVDLDGDGTIKIVAAGGSRFFEINERGMLDAIETGTTIVPGNSVVPADFDGDGDSDLFITRRSGLPNSLLRNDGNETFVDVTIETGLLSFDDTACAVWLDYDSDGLLDLLVGSYDHPLELYHQTAGKIFQPVAWDLRLWIPRGVHEIKTEDLNRDGFPDFFVGVVGGQDHLFLSQPSATWNQWRFRDIAGEHGLDSSPDGVTAAFTDINNDGLPDLVLGTQAALPITPEDRTGIPASKNLPSPPPAATSSTLRLFENRGETGLVDVTGEAGLAMSDPIFAIGVADIDNDGFEDLLVGTAALAMNRTFSNRCGTGFQEISVVSGSSFLDRPEHYAITDLDGNGSVDVLYLNQANQVRWLESGGALNRWVSIRASGHPPGLHFVLQLRDRDWILRRIERMMNLDTSILVGIGQAEMIERIDFYAPGETTPLKTLDQVEPNRRVTVELPKLPGKRAIVPLDDEKTSKETL